MRDLSTTACSRTLTCHINITLNPRVAKLTHTNRHHHLILVSQKSYNGLPLSLTKYLQFKHMFARPHEHCKSVMKMPAFVYGAGGLQADYEIEKAENSMQAATGDGDEDNDRTHDASTTEEHFHAIATHGHNNDASSFSLERIAAFSSKVPQTDNTAITEIVHAHSDDTYTSSAGSDIMQAQVERVMKRKAQQFTYLFAALASSLGITSLAAASVYYRFAWQMEGEVPWTEMFGTFSLALGAAVGMEYWARWAHRALWHASLWSMHESHHRPRDGPFELNDVFAIINAIPAIALMAFGFLHKGLVPGLCFGAGLGITIFGIAYMFVHDGLVHRRFPVGPIADVPYFQKVAAAHQLHHADKFNGVPYGLFLGPTELEEVGGRTELEKLLQKRKREKTNPING